MMHRTHRKWQVVLILLVPFAVWALFFLIDSKNPWNHRVSAGDLKDQPRQLDSPSEKISQEIIAQMTLAEKVGQLFHIQRPGKRIGNNRLESENFMRLAPGGVILFGPNLDTRGQIKKLTRSFQSLAQRATGIPLWISTDQEGGNVIRVQAKGVTQFPSALAFGVIGDPAFVKAAAFMTAVQISQLGINYLLAPVLDVNSNPQNPVIHVRSFGTDPQLVARMGEAFLAGVQETQMLNALKHFPGHGDTIVDSHDTLPTVNKSIPKLWSNDFFPFAKVIRAGAESVMLAHIVYPHLDNKIPASLSQVIVQGILRKQMQFDGLVISDDLGMAAIIQNFGFIEAAELSLRAGVDILLMVAPPMTLTRLLELKEHLILQYEQGRLSLAQLDKAVYRQISLKVKKGVIRKFSSQESSKKGTLKKIESLHRESLSRKERETTRKYRQMVRKESPEDFNRRISASAIRSLGSKIELPLASFFSAGIFLLRDNQSLKQRTTDSGPAARWLPNGAIERYGSFSALQERALKLTKITYILVIEFGHHCSRIWNEFVKGQAAQEIPIYGLYSSNPYIPLEVPKRGALLLSFSNTLASRQALLHQLLKSPQRKISAWVGY